MSEEELQEMLNKEPVELLWDKIHSLQQENKELKEEKQKLIDTLSRMPLEKTLMQCEIDTYKERIDKAIEYIKEYDVFKEYSFPLMNRHTENEIKSSIDFEFNTSVKKSLLKILEGDK